MKPLFKHRPFGRCFWSAFKAMRNGRKNQESC